MAHEATQPKLFIYIPTYNRPASLRRQLAAIAGQRAEWPGPVRILVSDNGSSEMTAEQLDALASEFGCEVRRNAANIGGNANIALGFVFARADEYLWILSDNDILVDGAITRIVADGLAGDPDMVTFDTRATQAHDFEHRWERAWSDIHETGLISNVIYKYELFAPQASAAFFYHNTSFPHLCVLLSTLQARKALACRVMASDAVFVPHVPHGEEPGNYTLSYAGMPQLMPLLPADEARRFARSWLRDQGLQFFAHRDVHPLAYTSTRACLNRYGGVSARLRLALLPLRYVAWRYVGGPLIERARAAAPAGLKDRIKDARAKR